MTAPGPSEASRPLVELSGKPSQVMTSPGSSKISPRRKLADDVIYYIARYFTSGVADIAQLRQTCRRYAELLEEPLYNRDVLESMAIEHAACRGTYNNSEDDPRWIKHLNRPCMRRDQRSPLIPVDEDGPVSALHWAANCGHVSVAKAAIKAALRVAPKYLDAKDPLCFTPLALAAKNGNIEVLHELINAGCFIHAPIYGFGLDYHDRSLRFPEQYFYPPQTLTPLTLATFLRQEATAIVLAQHTIDPDETYMRSAHPPLHMAAMSGMPRVVSLLLSQGCSVSHVLDDFESLQPLHCAAADWENNHDVIDILIDHGASVHDKSFLSHIIDEKNDFSKTAIHRAIHYGNWNNAAHLISKAENVGDWVENTFSYVDQIDNHLPITQELTKLLNKYGAFGRIQDALQRALVWYDGNPKTVQFLANFLAVKLNRAHLREGQGYLHWALEQPGAIWYTIDFVLTEAQCQIDVNARDANGCTPLDYAERHGHDKIARLLQGRYGARRGDEAEY
ncbi:ankyrin [Hypoxylon sp. FL1857]|nr:ankyrin [Hypoxylon sp. FL1857]